MNPNDAIVQVENYLSATSQIAQTTLRAVLGRAELDTLLSERDRLNDELQQIIDEQTEPWGIKVTTVEIKDVEIPQTMQRAMARQAEAERERRAKIIAAEGEFQASDKLAQAAAVIGAEPVAIQLRYLQTLLEIGSEHNSTTIFPLPIDLITPFLETACAATGQARRLSAVARAADRPAHGSAGRARPGPRGPPVQLRVVARRTTRRARNARCAKGHERLDAAGDVGAATGRRRRRLARLGRARGAEQVPAAGAGRRRRRPASRPTSRRGEPDLLVSLPATGHHEVIVHSPEHVASHDGARSRAVPRTRSRAGWSGPRAHAGAAYVHLMVNEGQRRRRLARALARAAVRARLRAGDGRARARALHGTQHAHDGRVPAVRPAAGGGAPPRARRRGRRPRGAAGPVRVARALRAAARAAPPRAQLRGRRTGGGARRCCAKACRSCAPSSAARRRSTCGCAPRPAGPSTSTGTSTSCRA